MRLDTVTAKDARRRGGVALAVLAAFLTIGGAARAETPDAFIAKVNGDKDKTLSLPEVTKYALTRFDALDTDHDGSLTAGEIGTRMSPEAFKEANTKHEGATPSLSKSEFTVAVAKLFSAANDHRKKDRTGVDGSLSAAELATPDGERLIKLLE